MTHIKYAGRKIAGIATAFVAFGTIGLTPALAQDKMKMDHGSKTWTTAPRRWTTAR